MKDCNHKTQKCYVGNSCGNILCNLKCCEASVFFSSNKFSWKEFQLNWQLVENKKPFKDKPFGFETYISILFFWLNTHQPICHCKVYQRKIELTNTLRLKDKASLWIFVFQCFVMSTYSCNYTTSLHNFGLSFVKRPRQIYIFLWNAIVAVLVLICAFRIRLTIQNVIDLENWCDPRKNAHFVV